MNDQGQEQQSTNEQPPRRGISFFESGVNPETKKSTVTYEEFESPEIELGGMGSARMNFSRFADAKSLTLGRYFGGELHGNVEGVLITADGKMEPEKEYGDLEEAGYYGFDILLNSPQDFTKDSIGCNLWIENTDLNFHGQVRNVKKPSEGNPNAYIYAWRNPALDEAKRIYVAKDPELLSKIRVNFERRPQPGGEI